MYGIERWKNKFRLSCPKDSKLFLQIMTKSVQANSDIENDRIKTDDNLVLMSLY